MALAAFTRKGRWSRVQLRASPLTYPTSSTSWRKLHTTLQIPELGSGPHKRMELVEGSSGGLKDITELENVS